ncbi:hypothetical protein [Streptomyces sp. GC420]|uniref:hypothetical protein n=1 Tax=Streptomyces sp. GC420 TaxID=2697568 RepID=UPI001414DE90|nr:hypothetical protein [Streptomyces sp. GC420]
MSFHSSDSGSARPDAAAANEAIRMLVEAQAGGEWPAEEYEQLLAQWATAVSPDLAA